MARDHALCLTLGLREGVLRLYQWERPTISFGRNEPAKGLYREDKAEEEGVGFVRRPTGGRAVLHHEELTYALVFPVGAFSGLKRAYRRINQGLLMGLERLGAEVELASPDGPSLRPDAGPCFRQPAEGEVTALGRKLVGSAQVRMGASVLQHGSIILDGDQGLLQGLRCDGGSVPPPATLRAALGSVPSLPRLRRSLVAALEATLGGEWGEGSYTKDEKMAEARLLAHYEDQEWTWRY